jgi:glycosyltransferase involved in cell wall biosynthesis
VIVLRCFLTSGMAAYLADVRDTLPLHITVIANTRNLGFPAAINRGLECARGEYIVILNNDAVVMDGWLEQLGDLASIRVTSESRNGTTSRMFTTEFTENTEGAEARRFRGLKNEYPGREITVNDLAPESIRPRQMTLLANADPPASFYAAGVVVVGLACAVD